MNEIAPREEQQSVERLVGDARATQRQRADLELQDEAAEILGHQIDHPRGMAEDEVAPEPFEAPGGTRFCASAPNPVLMP